MHPKKAIKNEYKTKNTRQKHMRAKREILLSEVLNVVLKELREGQLQQVEEF